MPSFEDAARSHANSLSSEGSRKMYLHDLAQWLRFCAENSIDPARPTRAGAGAFRDELKRGRPDRKQEPQQDLTIRRVLSALCSMYEEALVDEPPAASQNPFKRLDRPKADAYSLTAPVSVKDAEALLSSAARFPDEPDEAIIRLMFDTGLRRSSIVSLERAHVAQREGVTVLRVSAKGGIRREVVLPQESADVLARWLRASSTVVSPWVFPAGRGSSFMDVGRVNKIMNRHCKLAGIAHAHPHQFRATYATTAFDAGVPLREIQESLFHASPLTSTRYDRGIRGGKVSDAVAKHRAKKKDEEEDK